MQCYWKTLFPITSTSRTLNLCEINDVYKITLLLKSTQEEKLQKLNESLKRRGLFVTLMSDLGKSSGSLERFCSFVCSGLRATW